MGLDDHFAVPEERMANASRLIFAACGTSWHSSLIAKYVFHLAMRDASINGKWASRIVRKETSGFREAGWGGR